MAGQVKSTSVELSLGKYFRRRKLNKKKPEGGEV